MVVAFTLWRFIKEKSTSWTAYIDGTDEISRWSDGLLGVIPENSSQMLTRVSGRLLRSNAMW
jgi:hypothetical protein